MNKLLTTWLVVLCLVAGACSDDDSSAADDTTTTTAPTEPVEAPANDGSEVEGSITVSAASSLRHAFTELGEEFTAANPDAEVTFNFDSSTSLVNQIVEGASVDVFAAADPAVMQQLLQSGLVSGYVQMVADNRLVIVTKPGNPLGVAGLADLPDAGVVALCGADVPCGRYSSEALENAGVAVDESSVTRGQNASATLTAVTEGDADAGIVYATDAQAAGDAVTVVELEDDHQVDAHFPIAVIATSGQLRVAEAFMAFAVGPEGQAILNRHGFVSPT